MRTREEVIEHLKKNGYKKYDIAKICGYVFALGLKNKDEKFKVLIGDLTFDDFLEWFNDETNPLETLVQDLFEKLEESDDEEVLQRVGAQLRFLMEVFDIEMKEDEDE